MSEQPMIPVDLRADGILWAINAAVFHPHGFALAVDSTGGFVLQGDGSEVWQFSASLVDEKFAAFKALLERARM